MKWVSTYRGYEIRHSTVRDGDGFARYDAEIRVGGEWTFASCEALDDATIERELDAFINKLAARGLVERRPSKSDRRSNLLKITPAGRVVLERIMPRQHALIAKTMSMLGEAEIAALEKMLTRVHGAPLEVVAGTGT